MSHITIIERELKNINALKDAAKSLGCTIHENRKVRGYYGEGNEIYPYVLMHKSTNYDVGIKVSETGELSLHGDFYGGGLKRVYGGNYDKLCQEYSSHVVKRQASDRGYAVSEIRDQATGRIRLVLSQP